MTACNSNKEAGVPAIDLGNLDTLTAPGVDFYQYATGGWQAKNPLGPEFARFGSFDQLSENNIERLNDLFASMTELEAEQGTIEQKISDLYKMGLDSVRLNQEGAAPVKPYLEKIFAVSSPAALAQAVAELHKYGETPFFGAYVEADLKDSGNQILYLSQGGLGIGKRDYYVDPAYAKIKEGYCNFIARIFDLCGYDGKAIAKDVIAVEDRIAAVSWTGEQTRDVVAQYNPRNTKEFIMAHPGVFWEEYFSERQLPYMEKFIECQPSFFKGLDAIVKEMPLSVLRNYVAATLLRGSCGALSDDFIDAEFDFYSRQLRGVQQQRPRWKRAMAVPDGILGEAVGKMYVERYFPASSKEKMITLVENLRVALGEHIDSLDWMSDETKARAREKLAAFTVKIGYPDVWKDYSSLDIYSSLSYFENLKSASQWYVSDNISKMGKPTDKTEWGMSPQTVNAYYNPTTNEICFPAAILQPPFFNPDADDPVNYGGIGVVIGHEMSHGFDDQGRLFDAEGNMSNWWTDEDNEKFTAKAEVLAAQFDKVEVLPGVHANGHYTLGENIGDHGGLSIAFTAMQNALKGKKTELIDGFTPEQRFYLSYAAIWAQNITDEEIDRRTKTDVHSLAKNRVNVSIRNFQSFFDAFGIKEGDPMFLPQEERVHIW